LREIQICGMCRGITLTLLRDASVGFGISDLSGIPYRNWRQPGPCR
jgi:hypothetical protein